MVDVPQAVLLCAALPLNPEKSCVELLEGILEMRPPALELCVVFLEREHEGLELQLMTSSSEEKGEGLRCDCRRHPWHRLLDSALAPADRRHSPSQDLHASRPLWLLSPKSTADASVLPAP